MKQEGITKTIVDGNESTNELIDMATDENGELNPLHLWLFLMGRIDIRVRKQRENENYQYDAHPAPTLPFRKEQK